MPRGLLPKVWPWSLLALLLGGCAGLGRWNQAPAPLARARTDTLKRDTDPNPPVSLRPRRAKRLTRTAALTATRPALPEVYRYLSDARQLTNLQNPRRDWQYIVIHHSATETGSLASIDRYHREQRGWDECGYHFVIGNGTESGDGQIEVGGRWTHQKHGAHCRCPGRPEYNSQGIGVCLVGNFNQTRPTPKQLQACRLLVAYLTQNFGISPANVTTHGDLVDGHTECPGRHFDLGAVY